MEIVNVNGVDLMIDIEDGGVVKVTDKIGVWKAKFVLEEDLDEPNINVNANGEVVQTINGKEFILN